MTSSASKESKERRQLERKYLLFYLRVLEGADEQVLGHLVNFSEGGLMLLSDSEIDLEKKYRLRLRLPAFTCERSELVFDAVSRWCRKDANPEFYLAGYELDRQEKSAEDGNNKVFTQLQRLENFTRIYRSTWNSSLV